MRDYVWRLVVKYDPNQPRVPSGSPEGGRWTAVTFADQVRLQRDIRDRFPRPVRDTIAAGVRKFYADRDITDHDVEMYLDVMSMGEDKFHYYGDKIGLENTDELWKQYSAESKAVDLEEKRKLWEMRDAATFHSSDPGERWDAYYESVPGARRTLQESYGTKFVNDGVVSPAMEDEHASMLMNLAADHPAIATILKERVRSIRYERRRTGDTSSARWLDSEHAVVIPYRDGDWEISPSVFAHELGHAAADYVGGLEGLDKMGFGQGRTASSYGWINGDEDWAEWFTGALVSVPDLNKWDRKKYARVRGLIDSMGG